MANLVQELLIKIGIKADTAQANQAADAIARTGKSAKQAADDSKDLASSLGKATEVGGATTNLIQNLEKASRGGADGMMSAAKAALNLGNVIKTVAAGAGPIGIAIAIIGTLIGVVGVLRSAFRKSVESVDTFKARLADLDKQKLDALQQTIAALDTRLKGAREEADALRGAMDKVDDAEMGARLQALRNRKDLSDEERGRQEFLIRDEFKRRREGRETAAAQERIDQAAEKRDALAPEFRDARDRFAQLDNERDAQLAYEREIKRIDRDRRLNYEAVQQSLKDGTYDGSNAAKLARMQADESLLARRNELSGLLKTGDAKAKFEAEWESTRDTFQGKDGKGGIAAEYQAAATAVDQAERAMGRMLDTRKKVAEWDKANARLTYGEDPRDTEAAARRSPGKARMVRGDGTVVEYDVSAAPTTAQDVAADTDAARRGPVAKPPNTIQRGGGALPSDLNHPGGLQEKAASVSESASKTETAVKEQTAQLEKVATGAATIADSQGQLLGAIAGMVTAQLTTAKTQEQANIAMVGALNTLATQLADLAQKVRIVQSQASAARARAATAK